MTQKQIQLSIPTPCQQPWQAMEINETGRFCGSCQKTVVNFADMSDQQITAYFSTGSGKVCGRFSSQQLNRNLAVELNRTSQFTNQRWLGLITAGLLSWSSVQGQAAQLAASHVLADDHASPELQTNAKVVLQQDSPIVTNSLPVISGQVIAKFDNAPLPNVNVTIKGTDSREMTDLNGLFMFKLSNPLPHDGKLTLVVSGIGYATQEIEISVAQQQLMVSLAEDLALTAQVIYVGEVTVKQKPNFFQRIRNRFRTNKQPDDGWEPKK